MSVAEHANPTAPRAADATFDVLIVGAGLSGIGAACRLAMELPHKRYAILESRAASGGTWDLFRYPGVRSDSDMFTLAYPFAPWRGKDAIAEGRDILAYLRDTAARHGVDAKIRYRHRVVEASWSSERARWEVVVEVGEARTRAVYACRFLYTCCGYYDYEEAYRPELPGLERFEGQVLHPQWWPEDLDLAGKRVVVIGSGATAATLVPALAARGAEVTMLQRSPTYMLALPGRDVVADGLRRLLPAQIAHRAIRAKNVLLGSAFYAFARRFPTRASALLRGRARAQLPASVPIDPHFTPRYQPWDERLCVVRDGDLFAALSSGKAAVVTDTIAGFGSASVELGSGASLPADVLVTATGLKLLAFGGMRVSVDGRAVEPGALLAYKGVLLEGLPNFAACIGYVNASWTLRADLSSRYVCRLLAFLDEHGYAVATPRPRDPDQARRPILDLASGYARRGAAILPKHGEAPPWRVRQSYLADARDVMRTPIDDGELELRAG